MNSKGFTLVELITVMILVGILAVAALPRFSDQSVFEARGFRDETLSMLSYAQKAAVAQRRTVCVTLGGAGVTLSIASADGSTVCNTVLALPNAAPRGGTGLTASVASFNFLPTGGTNQGADISVSISGSSGTITIDRTTGYVY